MNNIMEFCSIAIKVTLVFFGMFLAAYVLFAPVIWAFTLSPWYMFLMFVSWIPALIIIAIVLNIFKEI